MRRMRGAVLALTLFSTATLLAACGDDPAPGPTGEAWQAVSIQGAPERGILFGIAFAGSRALAVGADTEGLPPNARYTPFVAEPAEAGTWRRTMASWLPADGLLTAVGFSAGGEAIIAGADLRPGGGAFVLDERGGWNRIGVPVGALAFAGSGGVLRLAGSYSAAGEVLVSDAADSWRVESLPFPSAHGERGLLDMAARDGVWVACGFDDGAEGTPESPHGVLFRKGGGGWERLASPCGGCSNREFRAVALGATGALFAGGALTDFGAGAADDYVAFLLVRSPGGDWAEIVLPNAGRLDRVNDILIASDRAIYLACGTNGFACILRSPVDGPATCEVTLENARVDRLAEGPGGAIYAAGATLDPGNPDLAAPALWRRVE